MRYLFYFIIGFSTISAQAAEWIAEPSVSVQTRYNDNVNLSASNDQDSTSYSASAQLNTKVSERHWNVNMDGRLRSTRYADLNDADADNIFFDLGGLYKTERHQFKVDSGFERNTSYDDDFDTQLPSNGLLADNTERETIDLSTSWRWNVTRQWMLDVGLSASDVEYDEVSSTTVSDYDVRSINIGANYGLTETSYAGVSIYFLDQNRDEPILNIGSYSYDVTGFNLSYDYFLSKVSRFSISFGSKEVDTKINDVPLTSQDTRTLDLSYRYSTEISTYSFSASQDIATSTDGFAQEVQDITFKYSHKYSQRLFFDVLLNANRADSVDSTSTSEDRDIYRFDPQLRWKFSKHGSLSVGYRYIEQELLATSAESESNSVFVNVYMSWPKLASSN